MSADAWEQCPICHNLPDEWQDGIDHLYGKLSQEEFKRTEQEYDSLLKENTVREDYECGLDSDGTAYFEFYAECTNCGAKWKVSNKNIGAYVD